MTLDVALDVTAVPARPAGAGQYTLALAERLAASDDLVLSLICRHGDDGRWAMIAPRAKVAAGAPLARPLRLAWEQAVMPMSVRRRHVQVLHSPHYTMPERLHLPKVVTVHDMTFFDHPEWHERAKIPFFRRAIKVASRKASAIVCVSEHTAGRLRSRLDPQVPIHVIPHGVDHRRFTPIPGDDDAVLAAVGVTKPFVTFVGTIEPRKSVDHLVHAFDRTAAAHPDLQLVLAGGDGWGVAAVDDAIAASRHRDRIIRTGYVPDDAVPALLRQAAAVAYPAAEEGFGLPALEALACEAPLVTTKGSVMEEVAGPAALLVPPFDVDGLAGALDMLVRGDSRLAGRRAVGRAIADRYTWERCAAAHVEVYRSVASH